MKRVQMGIGNPGEKIPHLARQTVTTIKAIELVERKSVGKQRAWSLSERTSEKGMPFGIKVLQLVRDIFGFIIAK